MRSHRLGNAFVIRAPAKANLFLEILAKRPDGYHELQTLMTALRLCDVLTFADRPDGEVRLTCTAPGLSTGPDNLVVKAARLLRDRVGVRAGADIRLVKRIPTMAGLAGGSADAAATLWGLNAIWRTGLSRAELVGLAGELGSDVAFFFSLPAAWCTGRGEIVTPVRPARALHLTLVLPPFGCATPAVFRHVRVPETPVSGDAIRTAFEQGDAEAIGRALFNRLEPAAVCAAPELAPLLARMRRENCLGVLMSGSGSALFALGRDATAARETARRLRQAPEMRGCRTFAIRTADFPQAL